MRLMASALGLAMGAVAPAADAQDFPTGTVTLVVPSNPGGITDFVARLLAEELQAAWGQTVIVESRGGAAGQIGISSASRQAPDGYTLFFITSGTHSANPTLITDLQYDPDDMTLLAKVHEQPFVLIVGNDHPAQTVEELVEIAKRDGPRWFLRATARSCARAAVTACSRICGPNARRSART